MLRWTRANTVVAVDINSQPMPCSAPSAAKGNSGCITQRDLIAKKLKAGQLAEGQRLATDFTPHKENEKQ